MDPFSRIRRFLPLRGAKNEPMSQQGADDWWQKLYGTPGPGPADTADPADTRDPADTLDSRFHSASSLTHRIPHQPGPPDPAGVLPGRDRAPARPDTVRPPDAVPPGREPVGRQGPAQGPPPQPGPMAEPPPPEAPPGPPGAGAVPPAWGPGAVPPVPPVAPPVPPVAPPIAPPPPSVLPRPRREADPEPAPPWDPSGPGTTGYGLGSVTVPPALPEVPPEPPVRRWGAPPERLRDADSATQPPPAPAPHPGADSWPGADRREGVTGAGGHPPQGDGAGRADAAGPGPEATVPDAVGPAPHPARDPAPGSDPVRDPRSDMVPPAPWEAPGGPGSWPAETETGTEADAEAEAEPDAGAAPVALQPLAGDPVAGEPWSASGAGAGERPVVGFLGDRAPTYAPEPGSLPLADPAALEELVPDTVLEGARHGTYTLRATSVRGDSARFRGEARRDFLLTARFGTGDDALVLAALAGGDRSAPGAADAAAELCRWIASAVGRSRERLADDIRSGRRDALRSGLQRLTDRGYGRLRAHAAELGLPEDAYTAGLRVLLLPIDPECKTRVCFGSGAGGLFRLRDGAWQDLEPEAPEGGAEGFRFRAAVARPRDTLLLCSGGLADPMREEGLLPAALAARWAEPEPPGLAAFLADTQLRLKGYADDRTAAAVWEA
ncbi:hypothetical protein GCM10017778_00180 [Streptomyces vinaceus]|nr:hypothetical protein GCM10017778_00180 [Streptomyces vinaceus]